MEHYEESNSFILWITEMFGERAGAVAILIVTIISFFPVIERSAIPIAHFVFELNWWTAMLASVIGNMIPIPFILLFLEAVFKFMKKHNILKSLVIKLENKAATKNDKISKVKFFGLMLFVAIPLPIPGTGAWTGALVASVMKMDKKSAFLSILIGVIIASAIITFTTYVLVDPLLSN